AEQRIAILTSGWPYRPGRRYLTLDDLAPVDEPGRMALRLQRREVTFWEAHAGMAAHYSSNGQHAAAIKEGRALVKAYPLGWRSHQVLAQALISAGQYNAALQPLKQSLSLKENAYAYKSIGTIFLRNREVQQAIPYLEKAVVLEPNDHRSRYNLSGAYVETGDIYKAVTQLEILLAKVPDYPNARRLYEYLRTQIGNQ
ncbi:MAG: tetratricopeptide repeat protein, partial [Candidatus Neomarinimicrobiota bacterium]